MRQLKNERPKIPVKRTRKTKPTAQQIKAFNIALKNPNKPMIEVMREAGYAENTAIAPSKNLLGTETWQQLMNEYLPDEHLIKVHREIIDSPREIRTYVKGELTTEVTETSPQQTKGLDMAYKLKGRYQDVTIDKALIVNVSQPIASKYGSIPKQIERHID